MLTLDWDWTQRGGRGGTSGGRGGVSACGGEEENSGGGEEPGGGVSSSEERGGHGFCSVSGPLLGLGRRWPRMLRSSRSVLSLSEDCPPSHDDSDMDRDVFSFPLLR